MNVGYSWTFGPPAGGPPGIGVFFNGAGGRARSAHVRSSRRVIASAFFVNAQNLTNRANYTGYSGTMTSPFFRQATAGHPAEASRCRIEFRFLTRRRND